MTTLQRTIYISKSLSIGSNLLSIDRTGMCRRISLVTLLLLSPSLLTLHAQVTATTVAGKVQSSATDTAGVIAFKGIPYAAAPVGNLRWQPPQPAPHWDGVHSGAQYGPDCMQKPVVTDAAPLGVAPAEDCLYLNVWSPKTIPAGSKLPVMVWIYGGGLVNGGSSPSVYDGSAFARDGILFVSFNYRLNRFGFFGHPALTKEAAGKPIGNYGFLDEIAALQWVKANIAAFSGDPNNVTIFGESGGGRSVHMLLGSPLAKGLFQRAMIESGSGRSNLSAALHQSMQGRISGEQAAINFAASVEITKDDPSALEKLRSLPADKVLNGLNMLTSSKQEDIYAGAMIDGQIVPLQSDNVYTTTSYQQVPLIIGANSMDAGAASASSVDQLFAEFGAKGNEARKAYGVEPNTPLEILREEVGSDGRQVEPARFVAQCVSATGPPGWEFRFSYVA